MKKYFTIVFVLIGSAAWSQPVFKAGWNNYPVGTLTRQYSFDYNNDTSKLMLMDSAQVFVSPDSLVSLTIHYPTHDRSIYKTINYFNIKKLVVKTEEYKDENMTISYEWRYDDKNRKNYYFEDNKLTGNNFRKTYEYTSEKKSGENIVNESSYYNGRIEFYTKSYFDKKNVKYKEVRLNDNNKDVVHIESYVYDEYGKLKERSVYFPEWKVTRKFEENQGSPLPKCIRSLPVGTNEKINLSTKIGVIKRLLGRNYVLFSNPECEQFEYTFKNFTNCEIVVSTTNVNHGKKVVFKYKDKV